MPELVKNSTFKNIKNNQWFLASDIKEKNQL